MPCHDSMPTRSTDNSYPTSRGSISVAVDKRWLTIYNVCLDVFSPVACNLHDRKRPLSATKLSQDSVRKRATIHEGIGIPSRDHIINVEQRNNLNDHAGFCQDGVCIQGASAHNGVYSTNVLQQVQSLKTVSRVKEIMDFGIDRKRRDTDMFDKQFNESTTTLKDLNNMCLSVGKEAPNIEVGNYRRCREEREPGETEMQEMIFSCNKALESLNAAADNALRSFLTLNTLAPREEIIGNGPGAQLYNEAAEMLAVIAQKIQMAANSVHPLNE